MAARQIVREIHSCFSSLWFFFSLTWINFKFIWNAISELNQLISEMCNRNSNLRWELTEIEPTVMFVMKIFDSQCCFFYVSHEKSVKLFDWNVKYMQLPIWNRLQLNAHCKCTIWNGKIAKMRQQPEKVTNSNRFVLYTCEFKHLLTYP